MALQKTYRMKVTLWPHWASQPKPNRGPPSPAGAGPSRGWGRSSKAESDRPLESPDWMVVAHPVRNQPTGGLRKAVLFGPGWPPPSLGGPASAGLAGLVWPVYEC